VTPLAGQGDRPTNRDIERGAFAALELAILLPFVIVMLLLVVGFGRVERGRELVDQAAASAARAASLSTSPGAARTAAISAATGTLRSGGMSCAGVRVSVDTGGFHPGGDVAARVTCVANLAGLTLSGVPGHISLSATSTSPLEPYRQLTAQDGP
jgi:Flp pilus assembly protein TadG